MGHRDFDAVATRSGQLEFAASGERVVDAPRIELNPRYHPEIFSVGAAGRSMEPSADGIMMIRMILSSLVFVALAASPLLAIVDLQTWAGLAAA